MRRTDQQHRAAPDAAESDLARLEPEGRQRRRAKSRDTVGGPSARRVGGRTHSEPKGRLKISTVDTSCRETVGGLAPRRVGEKGEPRVGAGAVTIEWARSVEVARKISAGPRGEMV